MSRAEAANLVGMAGWRLHGKVRRGGQGAGQEAACSGSSGFR